MPRSLKQQQHLERLRLINLAREYKRGHKLSREQVEKTRQFHLGRKRPESTREKMRGSNNSQWKGDNIGYNTLHNWVRRNLLAPALCQYCNIKPPYDLANITGVYSRDFTNWKYLCRKCHMVSDNRIHNLELGRLPHNQRRKDNAL